MANDTMNGHERVERRDDLISEIKVHGFNPETCDVESLDQMIKAHQLKYIEHLLQSKSENELIEINIKDFMEYDMETQLRAAEIAAASKYDPDYFTKNAIDPSLHKPIQIASVITNLKDEVQRKTEQVAYHQKLIFRLREFRDDCAAFHQYDEKKKSWLANLLGY